jgi:hypothetical protein
MRLYLGFFCMNLLYTTFEGKSISFCGNSSFLCGKLKEFLTSLDKKDGV